MRIYWTVAAGLVVFLIATIGFFGWRDHRAVDRCHTLGGQTWDSGEHCVVGTFRVIDTHNRTWG